MVSGRATMNPSGSAPSAPSSSQGTSSNCAACNVRVMVRIRPELDIERRNHSSYRVVEPKPATREVVVTQTVPGRQVSSHNKTYSFDGVFNPRSTQFEVFQQVAQPLISEVLAGFNCTVFAYGQTGTGKTYTMEGQMDGVQESTGRLPTQAGIIPRAVHGVFQELEKRRVEYSVRVAYLEIYNEELCDLLSDTDHRLRIIDDMGKKGMLVDKLEEIPVTNPEDIITIISAAQSKRRVAETQMNKCSSRSHCIFTITICQKELHLEGAEEIIKVGKLNLVDLAGSENIARSGADLQTVRTKEAGMINTSLLALGRVISALVDRQGYVPYRDSKLTRLLQDSLGGKTKTVMLAAISPSSVNLEETLSTLDYAHRAKNIKNMPQLNKKMSKQVMMKEMQTEKDQLTNDLRAMRQRDGVWLTEARHQELHDDIAKRNELIDEMEAQLAYVTKELNELRQDHDEKANRLEECSVNRQKYQQEFDQKKELLDKDLAELKKNQHSIDVETKIHESLRANEQTVLGKMDQTRTVLERTGIEVLALHEKLDRQKNVVTSNVVMAEKLKKTVEKEITARAIETQQQVDEHMQTWQTLAELLEQWKKLETMRLDRRQNQLNSIVELGQQENASWFEHVTSQETRTTAIWGELTRRCDELHSIATRLADEVHETAQQMQGALDILEDRFSQWAGDAEVSLRERGLDADGDAEERSATCDTLRESLKRGLANIAERRKAVVESIKEQVQSDHLARKDWLQQARLQWLEAFQAAMTQATAAQDQSEEEHAHDVIAQLSTLDEAMEADRYSFDALLSQMSTQSESAVSSAAASRVARSRASTSARSAVEAQRVVLRSLREGVVAEGANAPRHAAELVSSQLTQVREQFTTMQQNVSKLRETSRQKVLATQSQSDAAWQDAHRALAQNKENHNTRHEQLTSFALSGEKSAKEFGEHSHSVFNDEFTNFEKIEHTHDVSTGATPLRPSQAINTTEFQFSPFPTVSKFEEKFRIAGEPDIPVIEEPPSPQPSRGARTPKTTRKNTRNAPASAKSRKGGQGSCASMKSVKSQKLQFLGKQSGTASKKLKPQLSNASTIRTAVRTKVKTPGKQKGGIPKPSKKKTPGKRQKNIYKS